MNEQIHWKQTANNPSKGISFAEKTGRNMNTDPRFPKEAGFDKRYTDHELPSGEHIHIHYSRSTSK